MNKYCFITPRQVGKSTRAIYEFLKSPEDTLFICYSDTSAEYINIKINPKYRKNIISQKKTVIDFTGIKRVIMDEFLFFSSKNLERIYVRMELNKIKEYYLYSTPNKQYSKKLIEFVKHIKEQKRLIYSSELIEEYFGFSETNNPYVTIDYKEFIKDFDFLYHNPMTDKDCIWVDLNERYPGDINESFYHNTNKFDIEVNGNIFIKPEYYKNGENNLPKMKYIIGADPCGKDGEYNITIFKQYE